MSTEPAKCVCCGTPTDHVFDHRGSKFPLCIADWQNGHFVEWLSAFLDRVRVPEAKTEAR